ncbi:response regulator transcription factor [Thalassospira sp.]|uniref:response regulator transcription factor n=1 Tax=Thalassospira sp. TaxID=1912094 RepID=UPI0027353895|nr:response regulator [Thalassospira sp.]MDP2697316.1 response regulator [Thalassospira sp.]
MPHTRSVLLVDDSKFARLLVRAFIEGNFPGWQVDEAEEADKAQSLAAQTQYDYFVIDFNMPGMNGIELGTVLRKAYPAARIALLTANIQQEIQKTVAALGIDFLAKPPTQEKITAYFKAQESQA